MAPAPAPRIQVKPGILWLFFSHPAVVCYLLRKLRLVVFSILGVFKMYQGSQ